MEAELDRISAMYDEKLAYVDTRFENGGVAQKAIAIALKMEIDTVKTLIEVAKGLCAELKKKEDKE
jgi:hypothetical protein